MIVTPGQDTALTIRNTLAGGRRAGFGTAVGVAAGQAVWTLAASSGLAAILVASEPVFIAIRLAGAAYLIVLGVQSLWAVVRSRPAHTVVSGRLEPRKSFRQGLFSNLGNPKMVVFFTSLLPQFVDLSAPTFVPLVALGLMFCSMTLCWLSVYAVVVDRVGDVLRRPAIRRAIEAVTGFVLLAFGLKVASEPVVTVSR